MTAEELLRRALPSIEVLRDMTTNTTVINACNDWLEEAKAVLAGDSAGVSPLQQAVLEAARAEAIAAGALAEMLRRCAEAVRNFRRDHRPGEDEVWIDWVPKHLDQLAQRLGREETNP